MVEGIIVNTWIGIGRVLNVIGSILLAIYNGNAKAVSTLQGILSQRLFAFFVSLMMIGLIYAGTQYNTYVNNPLVKTYNASKGVSNSIGQTVKHWVKR